MNLKCAATRRSTLIFASATIVLAFAALSRLAAAQTPAADAKPAEGQIDQQTYETFYLTYATDRDCLNDIQTALRNMLPRAAIFGVETQNAIIVRGTPAEIAMARKLTADLDRPRKVYRLTYTITDFGGNQPGSTRHYTLIVAPGDRTVFKQGDRVPIVVGSTAQDTGQSTSVQYMDVGLNIDALLSTSADALTLHSKIELSSVGAQSSGAGTRDPDVRQTVLQGASTLVPGKPLVLGSLDTPGTTRHEEVEVIAELVG